MRRGDLTTRVLLVEDDAELPAPTRSRAARTWPVWVALAAVHLWIAWCGVFAMPERVFRDLWLYQRWMTDGLVDGHWPVLDGPWVYPAGALLPLVAVGWAARGLAALGLAADQTFTAAWTVMVTALNFLAVWRLLRHPGGRAATWWWVGFLFALGPVAVGRLDAVVPPLVILALLAAARRPRLASALLTFGAWVKVAPGALLVPVVMMLRRSWSAAVWPAAAVSAAVLGVVGLLGGREHVWSFLSAQGGRGLQVEAVGATPWMVWGLFSDAVQRVYSPLKTYEVTGPGVEVGCQVLDGLFYTTMVLVALLLAWRAWGPRRLPAVELLARGSLLLMLTMIVTDKVLSPQYLTWLVAPVAVALAWQLTTRADRSGGYATGPAARLSGWWATAWVLLGLAAATQAVFPWGYAGLLGAQPAVTAVLVVRNVGLVVLWAVTVWAVVRPAETVGATATADAPEPTASFSTS